MTRRKGEPVTVVAELRCRRGGERSRCVDARMGHGDAWMGGGFSGDIGRRRTLIQAICTVWPSVLELLGQRLIKDNVRHRLSLSGIEPRGLIQ